jgi:hypothetical protein
LGQLRENVESYQEKVTKYVNMLTRFDSIVKEIKNKYGKYNVETFDTPNASIQFDTENDIYTIYIQLSINEDYFGLWCEDDFDCTEYSEVEPSVFIKYVKDNLYDTLKNKIEKSLPLLLADRLEELKLVLDPYSIHIMISISEETYYQPELPGIQKSNIKGVVGDVESPYMSLLEYTKLISERAKLMETDNNMGPTIDIRKIPEEDRIDAIKIAKEELARKQFPLDLIRYLPGGTEIVLDPNQMILPK